jgi:pimeloyl-ACP methyl ester carboxylesterase
MPDVTANGLRFSVVDEGTGTPVVLLHGFPDTSELWSAQVRFLVDAGYRAVAPDLRGRGRSDKPKHVEDFRLGTIAQDVAAIMEALGIERAHVVGHDWGAGLAWLFAALMPKRVDHLVAISVGHPGTGGNPTLEQLQKGWYRLLFQFTGVAEELLQQQDWLLMRTILGNYRAIDRAIADLSQPDALTASLNWYRANLPPERLLAAPRSLPPIQASTLGIFGAADLFLTEEPMRRSGEFVQGMYRYECIDGAGHWIPLEEPDRLNHLLIEFFQS